MKKPGIKRRLSAGMVPYKLATVVVGCAECHTRNPASHGDTFDHNGAEVHVVVSPKDCSTCHPEEADQYGRNMMSWARVNLAENKVYRSLIKSINGVQSFRDMETTVEAPDALTDAESCYHCHGTAVEVKGSTSRETEHGEMKFPVLSGWPNQGVGRSNPDGSRGSCAACHTRHQFSIETARKPYTCSQCHKGPDTPAYKAYMVSKHGNLFSTHQREWKFEAVPWTVGKDFTAPTCAVCHVSLIVDGEGEIVAKRTHQMSDRLPWRIFGLVYAHPHPKSPDTSKVRNQNGLPLPTTLTGKPAGDHLIDAAEMTGRRKSMQGVCLSCHSEGWVSGHWTRFENTIETTNKMTLTASKILLDAWKEKVADKEGSLFDEAIEKQWVEQWLFFANSTRFASAMMGADYGVFANGRWYMSKNIREMIDRFRLLLKTRAMKMPKSGSGPGTTNENQADASRGR